MPKIFKCYKCSNYLGEMIKGKMKKGALLFCDNCKIPVMSAMAYLEIEKGVPGLKDLFGGLGKKGK